MRCHIHPHVHIHGAVLVVQLSGWVMVGPSGWRPGGTGLIAQKPPPVVRVRICPLSTFGEPWDPCCSWMPGNRIWPWLSVCRVMERAGSGAEEMRAGLPAGDDSANPRLRKRKSRVELNGRARVWCDMSRVRTQSRGRVPGRLARECRTLSGREIVVKFECANVRRVDESCSALNSVSVLHLTEEWWCLAKVPTPKPGTECPSVQ